MFSRTQNYATIHWFRHGLRLHDNPALQESVKKSTEFFPVYIFDGESSGTKLIGYNRMKFLLDSLKDLDQQFKSKGGRLFVFVGDPVHIFHRLWEERCISKITFEQDCEPIWSERDNKVKSLCLEFGIECSESISHTLWDPQLVIKTNGGIAPLTYQMFLHTISCIGLPPRPVDDIDFKGVKFGIIPEHLAEELKLLDQVPDPEFFGLTPEKGDKMVRWVGGETHALKHLLSRLQVEGEAFSQGFYLTNQVRPDLVRPPTSQSAALRHGCLSVRRFYWLLHDLYHNVHKGQLPSNQSITGQLIWREYFYTMSVRNPYYAEMTRNPICLKIDWMSSNNPHYKEYLQRWKLGQTGYPFIDAAMRQLITEGWIHHVARNAVACFLTRGDLWISWEDGLQHFLKYLIDADWSVCAGNWMWVSSSAFEKCLDCSHCVCPVNFGRRLDPHGEYVMRYVPEVRNLPVRYIYEPWNAPIDVQEAANCLVGRDYPDRIVDHMQASEINRKRMEEVRKSIMSSIAHCCPSNAEEVRQFMWLPEVVHDHAF